MNKASSKPNCDLSIIITVHAEGILLHKTLASVHRAIDPLKAQKIHSELIIHCDNPTQSTLDYLDTHKATLGNAQIFINHFGDLGSSRNFAVKQALGKYVTFIDADDLMSKHWLIGAYSFLEAHTLGEYIAHSEMTVEFGAADSVVRKYGEINQATDTLLSVFANRWNSIIMAPRTLLLEEPYTPNSPGYGYEDWHLNSRFIKRGIHNILIPNTVIFVRRKEVNSEWLRQKQSRAVLRATPLFAFDYIRSLTLSSSEEPRTTSAAIVENKSTSAVHKLKKKVRPALKRIPKAEYYAQKIYSAARTTTKNVQNNLAGENHLPSWLIQEWQSMHSIEKQLFPSQDLVAHVPIYESLTPDHYQAAQAFQRIISYTKYNSYDYIFFVPWLIRGGADLFTIHYANTIKKLRPTKNILVISTIDAESPWSSHLSDGVDFIPFGSLASGLSTEIQHRLLEHLIENSGATHLHVINSELGYDFIESHATYITATEKHVIATSFSQSTDKTGRIFGYSHTHIPKIYDLAEVITTDNKAVTTMWTKEYGFNPDKLLVHHQPVEMPRLADNEPKPDHNTGFRILWASRLSPEKQPALIPEIARLLPHDIHIEMFGHVDSGYNAPFLQNLPSNVTYQGPYDGFYSLPLKKYDLFLYTSLFDGMPNTILEAGAAKMPIVSSAIGGIPELILNNKSGVLIEDISNAASYADAIIALQKEPTKLRQYATKLHDTIASDFSEEAFRESITSYLKRVNF